MNLRTSQRRRFAELLNSVREQRHLSVVDLCHLLGRPKSTVSMWLSGQRLPSQKYLVWMCAKLNVNHEAVFARDLKADVFFEDQIIGFDTLQQRYLEVRLQDRFRALSTANLAGFILHACLMKRGLMGTVTSDHDFRCVISITGKPYLISIDCLGEKGIGFTVYTQTRETAFPWHLLNKTNLDLLTSFLHTGSVHENH